MLADIASLATAVTSAQIGNAYSVGTLGIALDTTKQQGEAAVKLIEQATAAPPPPSGGKGLHVNTYA